ncbi:MAG: glycosyltransferase family 1 protein [Herpetosiphon sp.]
MGAQGYAVRIALDVRASGAHFPGVNRATVGLIRGLQELPDEFEIELVVPPVAGATWLAAQGVSDDVRFREHITTAAPFGGNQQIALPLLARRLGVDCWHAPFYVRPLFGLPPAVVTVYDVLGQRVPGALPNWRARLVFALGVRMSVRLARQVITTSKASARDLGALHHVPAHKLDVVPLGVDGRFRPQSRSRINEMRAKYGLPEQYVLYLGSNKPHKQPVVAVRAFTDLVQRKAIAADVGMVVAGHRDPRFVEMERAASAAPGRVHFLPDIADADVPALLSGALVFVFPSLYEGFGLPPLEAMACGTPVIATNRSSVPEVVGDAGLLVDPNEESFAGALIQVLEDRDLQTQLRERGLGRATLFSWRETACATLRIYNALFAGVVSD